MPTMPTREEKEAYYRLLEEKHARHSKCPVAKLEWSDNGQDQAAALIETVEILIASGGNRSGKTHFLAAELIATMLGYRPWLVKDFKMIVNPDTGKLDFPPRDQMPVESWVKRSDGLPIRHPASLLFVTGLSQTKGLGILQKKFLELLPKGYDVAPYLGPLGTWQKITIHGSTLLMGADTQSVQMFEGENYDLAAFDEPIRKAIYTAVKRGLVDHRGRLIWAMTPLGDARIAWVTRDMILNQESREDVAVVYLDPRKNRHIDQESLERFLNDPSMSESERRARASGEFGSIGRRIVSTFDESHVLIPETDLPPNVPRMVVVDPHHSKPACMVWFALVSDNHWIAYREWPTEPLHTQGIPRMSIHDLAGMIKTQEGRENVVYRFADPQFGRQHAKVLGQTFKSFQEEMAEYDLFFSCCLDNDIERGIQAMRDAFKVIPEIGHPKVQIFKGLRNSRNAISLWSYEDTPSGAVKVSEELKDFADVFRYAIMANPPAACNDIGCRSYLENESE